MDLTIIILAALVLLAIGLALYFTSVYNGLVLLKNDIRKSWANIDVLLTQRASELPKLIDSVKGYMKYEKGTMEAVTAARTAFLNAKSIPEKARADNQLSAALKSLFAVSENYPNLKANDEFVQLQSRISALENQIADRREFYNDSVNLYNIRIQSIPDSVVAGMLHYAPETMFKATDEQRQDVKVGL